MIKKYTNETVLEIVPIKNTRELKIKGYKSKEPSLKFKRWTELFLDKSNPKFYGNGTKCALAVYDTKNYNSASCIGYQNYRKLQIFASLALELEGFGFGEMMKIGVKKVLDGTFSDWEKMMEHCGYFQPKGKSRIKH